MIQIQEPKTLCEIFHMDCVAALSPGGDRNFNDCLVLVDRYSKHPKFTSSSWTNIDNLFGTKLSLLAAYIPQADGLSERMIQKLEDMIRRFYSYRLCFKESDGFIHY
ncbi:hypothetical protein O181_103916 [Austropuccinia psidii MF-1]|uniref:Uncharacterized protein n=1 Tax=Austropuccinia psidii MF-1 TaxID=1389203 RepID=A0A9Q3PKY1_9BASI|nr:hypothetical protein [Austropuccinia psidii MF-1]